MRPRFQIDDIVTGVKLKSSESRLAWRSLRVSVVKCAHENFFLLAELLAAVTSKTLVLDNNSRNNKKRDPTHLESLTAVASMLLLFFCAFVDDELGANARAGRSNTLYESIASTLDVVLRKIIMKSHHGVVATCRIAGHDRSLHEWVLRRVVACRTLESAPRRLVHNWHSFLCRAQPSATNHRTCEKPTKHTRCDRLESVERLLHARLLVQQPEPHALGVVVALDHRGPVVAVRVPVGQRR